MPFGSTDTPTFGEVKPKPKAEKKPSKGETDED